MALMCGGSFVDKVQAAFILFDVNNSNTLSFDELSSFMRTVFKILIDLSSTDKTNPLEGINLEKLTL